MTETCSGTDSTLWNTDCVTAVTLRTDEACAVIIQNYLLKTWISFESLDGGSAHHKVSIYTEQHKQRKKKRMRKRIHVSSGIQVLNPTVGMVKDITPNRPCGLSARINLILILVPRFCVLHNVNTGRGAHPAS